MLAQQAQRVQQATQAAVCQAAAFKQASESAELAQEAAAAHEAAELAAITQAAREILAEEEAERQLQPALAQESAQAAWHDTLSELHALVTEDPHASSATMYQPNYPELDHGTRSSVKSQHGMLVVEEPPLELYEGCKRQEDVPALRHTLDRVQSCKRTGFSHGMRKHLTRVSNCQQFHHGAVSSKDIGDTYCCNPSLYAIHNSTNVVPCMCYTLVTRFTCYTETCCNCCSTAGTRIIGQQELDPWHSTNLMFLVIPAVNYATLTDGLMFDTTKH